MRWPTRTKRESESESGSPKAWKSKGANKAISAMSGAAQDKGKKKKKRKNRDWRLTVQPTYRAGRMAGLDQVGNDSRKICQ
jgi:hypothetical protein